MKKIISNLRNYQKQCKICSCFSVTYHISKTVATVLHKEALNLWIEYMSRKRLHMGGKVLHQKALSLYEELQSETNNES